MLAQEKIHKVDSKLRGGNNKAYDIMYFPFILKTMWQFSLKKD